MNGSQEHIVDCKRAEDQPGKKRMNTEAGWEFQARSLREVQYGLKQVLCGGVVLSCRKKDNCRPGHTDETRVIEATATEWKLMS